MKGLVITKYLSALFLIFSLVILSLTVGDLRSAAADSGNAAAGAPLLSGSPPAVSGGQVAWTQKVTGTLASDMALAPNGDVLLPFRNQVTLLDPDGDTIWQAQMASSISEKPECAEDGNIFAAGGSGVQEIRPNGATGWSLSIYPQAGNNNQAMAYSGGSVFYTSSYGLYSLNEQGQVNWISVWNTMEQHCDTLPAHYGCLALAADSDGCYAVEELDTTTGYELVLFDPQGNEKWEYGLGQLTSAYILPGSDGTVYLALKPESTGSFEVSALSPAGKLKWNVQLYANGSNSNSNLLSPFLTGSGELYLTAGGSVYRVDTNTGTEDWGVAVYDITSPPAVDEENGLVFVGTSGGDLMALDTTGKFRWGLELGGAIANRPLVAAANCVYVSAGSNVSKITY